MLLDNPTMTGVSCPLISRAGQNVDRNIRGWGWGGGGGGEAKKIGIDPDNNAVVMTCQKICNKLLRVLAHPTHAWLLRKTNSGILLGAVRC
jgi:hypothetical protein